LAAASAQLIGKIQPSKGAAGENNMTHNAFYFLSSLALWHDYSGALKRRFKEDPK
jgi:hypothetical protein